MAYRAKIVADSMNRKAVGELDVMSTVKQIRRGEIPKDAEGKAIITVGTPTSRTTRKQTA